MTRTDRWIVAGAWAVLGACALAGTWKISRAPRVESWVVREEARWKAESRKLHHAPPARTFPEWEAPKAELRGGGARVEPFAASIFPSIKYVEIPLREVTVRLLPAAVYDSSSADQDGVLLEWKLEDLAGETAPANVRRTRSKPAAILVERAAAGEPRRAVASLEGAATRFIDRTAEPNRAYRYWVVVTGPETRLEGRDGLQELPDARREPPAAAALRTPPAHRVGVIGGDARVAVLRVERYDRETKAWVPRVLSVKPGERLGTSGWTLEALRTVPGRFGVPVLVADVTDETGARRAISREE